MMRATKEEIEAYLKKMGKHGMQTLSVLGKLQSFATCMESETGKLFLGGLVVRHEELLQRIAELKATDEEKLEFVVIKRLLLDFADKLNAYDARIEEIQKKANA